MLVTFVATDSHLGVGGSQPNLSYRFRLEQDKSIKLSTEEKFEDLDSSINVFADTDWSRNYIKTMLTKILDPHAPHEDDRKIIGYMTYVPAFGSYLEYPASCEVRVVVPKGTFDELLAAARVGHLPSRIDVEVEWNNGMEFEPLSEWRHQQWDNKTFPTLRVIDIGFSVPLIAQAMGNESDRHTSDEVSPPTRSQVKELSEKLDRLVWLLWAVLVIGVLMLILRIFR